MSIEDHPEWAHLSDHDKAEVKKFIATLHARAAAKRGEALDAPALLLTTVYGDPNAEIRDGRLQLLVPGEPADPMADVLCALHSKFKTKESLRGVRFREGQMVVLVLDSREGSDLSWAAGVVDGITSWLPDEDDEPLESKVRGLWLVWRGHPGDDLFGSGCSGGVSREAFEETLRQAALPDSDPNKRD